MNVSLPGHHHRCAVVVVPAVDGCIFHEQQLHIVVVANFGGKMEGAHFVPVFMIDVHRIPKKEPGSKTGRDFFLLARVSIHSHFHHEGDSVSIHVHLVQSLSLAISGEPLSTASNNGVFPSMSSVLSRLSTIS